MGHNAILLPQMAGVFYMHYHIDIITLGEAIGERKRQEDNTNVNGKGGEWEGKVGKARGENGE